MTNYYSLLLKASFIINEIAPKELKGYWTGLSEAINALVTGIIPLGMAALYDSIGDKRGVATLGLCTSISAIATLSYVPLLRQMPKPQGAVEMEEQQLSAYDEMPDSEWAQQPLHIQDKVNKKRIAAGLGVRQVRWGRYEEERQVLLRDGMEGLQARFAADFYYMREEMQRMLTHRKLVEESMVLQAAYFKHRAEAASGQSKEEAKVEMGKWMSDYLEDAGYLDWDTQAGMFKTMFINSFPPLTKLDGTPPDYASLPPTEYEDMILSFFAVVNGHIRGSNAHLATHRSFSRSFGAAFHRS